MMDNPFETKEVAEMYDGWYQSKVGMIYDYLEKKTIRKLIKSRGEIKGRMLEVGSGTGHWSQYFAQLGFDLVGVEKSKYMYNIAERKDIKNAKFINNDIFDYEPKEKFDCASFITTLEFIEKDKQVIKRVVDFI